jgi:hypothetical protein
LVDDTATLLSLDVVAVAAAAASEEEVDGFDSAATEDPAFFVGRFSGLNLPAWTGFFFGGMGTI